MNKGKITIYIIISLLISSCFTNNKNSSDEALLDKSNIAFINLPLYGNAELPLGFKIDNNTSLTLHRQIYECLFTQDLTKNKVKGLLISSFTSDADAMSYTFTLKDDIYFHDDICFPKGKGRKLLANDVVFCFKQLLKYRLAGDTTKDSTIVKYVKIAVADTSRNGLKNSKPDSLVKKIVVPTTTNNLPFYDIEALNDRQFRIYLMSPNKDIPKILCDPKFAIYAKEMITHYSNSNYVVGIGTGPFLLDRFNNNECILYKNPNYHQSQTEHSIPKLDAIRFIFVNSEEESKKMFGSQDLDIWYSSTRVPDKIMLQGDIKGINSTSIKEWNFKNVYIERHPFIKPYN